MATGPTHSWALQHISARVEKACGKFDDDESQSHARVGRAHQAGSPGWLFEGKGRLDEIRETPDGVREVIRPAARTHVPVPVDQGYRGISSKNRIVRAGCLLPPLFGSMCARRRGRHRVGVGIRARHRPSR